ncbi:hypothetical protein CC80DRAFT_593522 [Byssothecium circinans]|uniref:Uncharacterized protein n=1 Tax=Byssothecium circinans TaxID=147558 RepID=A0A6A5TYW9_9PLEO|nr:hypothetical protein CC80DRAFT_593522 [Byssothecium circinans]
MADSLDLAGVIGTWVAAALAIIALAGILPIYLLYRKSKTDRYTALNSVHDPRNIYLRYRRWPGGRFFRSYRVPKLQDPPEWAEIRVERKFSKTEARSDTGWLNFANVLCAYGVTTRSRGKLAFSKQQALLPVHRRWLLLLGIIDRYTSGAHRREKGLLVDEAEEIDMGDFGREAIIGLSGILKRLPPEPTVGDAESGLPLIDKVVFRMHPPEHMVKLSTSFLEGDVPIQTLLALYLGYLHRHNDYYDLMMPERPVTPYSTRQAARGNTPEDDSHKLWSWEETEMVGLPRHKRKLIEELVIRIPRVHKMKEIRAPDQAQFDQLRKSNRPAAENYLCISDKGKGIWIARRTLHVLMFAVLHLQTSRQSALSATESDSVLRHLFDSANLSEHLRKAQKVVGHCEFEAEEQKTLEDAILKLSDRIPEDGIMSWSRTRMDACVTLDEQLRRMSRKNRLLSWTITILYMQEEDFRHLCKSYDSEDPDTLGSPFELDISSNVVRAPANSLDLGGENPFWEFYFDFTAVYSEDECAEVWPSSMTTSSVNLSFPMAMMACLRGHLRMVIWEDMMLPATPLAEFYASLKSHVVHITPQETAPPSTTPQRRPSNPPSPRSATSWRRPPGPPSLRSMTPQRRPANPPYPAYPPGPPYRYSPHNSEVQRSRGSSRSQIRGTTISDVESPSLSPSFSEDDFSSPSHLSLHFEGRHQSDRLERERSHSNKNITITKPETPLSSERRRSAESTGSSAYGSGDAYMTAPEDSDGSENTPRERPSYVQDDLQYSALYSAAKMSKNPTQTRRYSDFETPGGPKDYAHRFHDIKVGQPSRHERATASRSQQIMKTGDQARGKTARVIGTPPDESNFKKYSVGWHDTRQGSDSLERRHVDFLPKSPEKSYRYGDYERAMGRGSANDREPVHEHNKRASTNDYRVGLLDRDSPSLERSPRHPMAFKPEDFRDKSVDSLEMRLDIAQLQIAKLERRVEQMHRARRRGSLGPGPAERAPEGQTKIELEGFAPGERSGVMALEDQRKRARRKGAPRVGGETTATKATHKPPRKIRIMESERRRE